MTTGDPVVVVGAMKPLPTLTKPLRSVDTETKEPAQALRERTDSCTVPAAGVVGEAMVALVLARRLPREVRRRPHGRRARRARLLPRADRLEARIALVLVGFMGAGKSTGARSLAVELGVEPLDSDRELEQRLGEPLESFFDREGEDAFRAREEEVVLELLSAGGRAGDRARRWVRSAPSGCARRSARTPSSISRSSQRRPGSGRPARGGRSRVTWAASPSFTATAPPSTSRWPTPCCRRRTGTRSAAPCPRCARSRTPRTARGSSGPPRPPASTPCSSAAA